MGVIIVMNLIVVSDLTCDEGIYFRYISMVAKEDLNYSVLVEANKEDIDYYYKKLKKHGWFDFVEDFVVPEWRIEGVRIDKNNNYPMTIRVPHILCENTLNILGQVKHMKSIF